MDKSKKNYWGIVETAPTGIKNIFEGTFNQCWDKLVGQYGERTLNHIANRGIKIVRIN